MQGYMLHKQSKSMSLSARKSHPFAAFLALFVCPILFSRLQKRKLKQARTQHLSERHLNMLL